MVFFSKKALNMVMLLSVIAMALVEAAAGDSKVAAASTDLSAQTVADKAYFVKFNGILWVSFIFLYIALSAAWKIVTDNAPDTQKDSILYAKFLTQNFNQKTN